MNLDQILAVSRMPGLYRLVTTRNNGLVIEDMDTGRRTFVSIRKHQFTPLQSVAIYTYGDTTEIQQIFQAMIDQRGQNPVPSPNDAADELHVYFRKILPDYNEDRVFVSDIKKIIKWFQFLDERNLFNETASDEEE